MAKGDEYRWLTRLFGPATYGSKEYQEQAEELIAISATLTDKQKTAAENTILPIFTMLTE
jgi:hypothetical protein